MYTKISNITGFKNPVANLLIALVFSTIVLCAMALIYNICEGVIEFYKY